MPASVLHQPLSIRQDQLPPELQPLHRPAPLGRAIEIAFLRFQKRALQPTERFWRDFGMQIVSSSPERLVARGAGSAPAIAIATRGSENAFLGTAFAMAPGTNLLDYVKALKGRWLTSELVPGGGQGVEVLDPCGRPVWLLEGQSPAEPLPVRADLLAATNTPHVRQRINRMVRTPIEPAQVTRLGHLVLQTVDFSAMASWYMSVLGLIPTDVQYLGDGSPNLAFMRLDLGSEPADHHTLVIVGGIEEKYEHSAYEVVDIDALGQGQQVLRAQGHRHLWGIGRHLLGSQLFDYWADPDGFEMEHYADGDLFTADHVAEYSPLDLAGLWTWGADVPPSMKPKKNLRFFAKVAGLLRRKAITSQRLKLIASALGTPARPWL